MTATAAPTTKARSGARRARRRAAVVGWAFLAPLLLLNLVVVAGPSVATVYYSFTDWSGLVA